MRTPHPRLRPLLDSSEFLWATGIEDTFITAPWPATGRTLDEYELTQHYERWEEDLRLMASLGVRIARYGVPWHRINPAPGEWRWESADRPLNRMLDLGIEPIVDLVHYGLPGWIEGAYLHPRYAEFVGEYAARMAERFRGRVKWYTPLNEPRITAWYCGRLGWWPPYRRGWSGFVQVMMGICRGIVETEHRLREIDPEIVSVHVDAADDFATEDPRMKPEVEFRRLIGFLALDLVTGRVCSKHPLRSWLLKRGVNERDLAALEDRGVTPDIIGANLYPMFSNKRVLCTERGLRIRSCYGSGDLVERIVRLYAERYRLPMMISETAARKTRRRDWLEQSVAAVRRLRACGFPLLGYTWWPMFALVAWAYRQSDRQIDQYLEQMGLWDLKPGPDGDLQRVETPLVAAYRELAAGGAASAGPLAGQALSPRARTA